MRSTALALSCKSQTRTANATKLLHNSIVVPIYSYLYRIRNHVMMQELTVPPCSVGGRDSAANVVCQYVVNLPFSCARVSQSIAHQTLVAPKSETASRRKRPPSYQAYLMFHRSPTPRWLQYVLPRALPHSTAQHSVAWTGKQAHNVAPSKMKGIEAKECGSHLP